MDFIVKIILATISLLIGYIIGQHMKQRKRSNVHHLLPVEQQRPAEARDLLRQVTEAANIKEETGVDTSEEEENEYASDDDDDRSPASFTDANSDGPNLILSNAPTLSQSVSAPVAPVANRQFTSRKYVVVVAKQLPLRTIKDPESGTWTVQWEDTRNFLSGLQILTRTMDVKWIGSPNSDVEITKDEQDDYEELLAEYNCIPVFLPKPLSTRFFNGFCKQILWPLLHYVVPPSDIHCGDRWDDYWQAYTAANTLYANAVTRSVESPTDMIFVQNYHLLLLPSFLRAKLPRTKIGLFVHTPFPSSDVFRIFPTRHNILSSIMAADLIGFHTFDYARHFLSCIKRVLDLDFDSLPGGALGIKYSGRFVSILISHVGIDSHQFRALAESEEIQQRVTQIRQQFSGKQLVIGVDDYDIVKGPLLKFQAYYQFLKEHPEFHGKMIFIEFLLRASGGNLDIKHKLLHEVDHIRQEFGESAIHLIEVEDDNQDQVFTMKEICAWYNASEVAVVSTFWDGLNLVPYEYSASQSPEKPGALVISEFMGCSRSLNGVFRVNPWSLSQVSNAIATALKSTLTERKANHIRRYQYVLNHTLERWASGFLDQLDRATKFGAGLHYVQVGWGSNVKLMGLRSDFAHLDEEDLTSAYRRASKRILLLDYDGTLTSTDKSVAKTRHVGPSHHLKVILKALSEDQNNTVFIMTGRTRSVLTEWFSEMPNLGLAAEKGLFLRWPRRIMKQCRLDQWKDDSQTRPSPSSTNSNNSDNPESSNTGNSGDAFVHREEGEVVVNEAEWENLISLDDISWKYTALDLIRAYTEQTDGSWVEDKEFSVVWHYEQADPEYGRMQASELSKYLIKLLSNPTIEVVRYDYDRILEVKPRGVSKGIAATAILESLLYHAPKIHRSASHASVRSLSSLSSLPASTSFPNPTSTSPTSLSPSSRNSFSFNSSLTPPQSPTAVVEANVSPFILCMGDDRGDEDMFNAVNNKDYLQGCVRFGREPSSNRAFKVSKSKKLPPSSSNPALASLDDEEKEEDDDEGLPTSKNKKKPTDPFSFTVCVGMKPSNAHYFLHDDEEVLRALHSLATCSSRIAQSRVIEHSKIRSTTAGSVSNLQALLY